MFRNFFGRPGCTRTWRLFSRVCAKDELPRTCVRLQVQGHSRKYWTQAGRKYEHFQPSVAWWQRKEWRVLGGMAGVGVVVWAFNREEVPYTHRKHFMIIPPRLEKQIGEHTFRQMVEQAARQGKVLPASSPEARRVARIGKRVAAVAADGTGGGRQDHMKGLEWEFVVIDDAMVNAMVCPGGKVLVFRGLLGELRPTDDELAAVLAHETAHVLARHPAERLSQAQAYTLVELAFYWLLGTPLPRGFLELAILLPNSRRHELEADTIGDILAARACFLPGATAGMLTKLAKNEEKRNVPIPAFLKTHPLSRDRVRKVTENLPAAQLWYEKSDCATRHFDLAQQFDLARQLEYSLPSPAEARCSRFPWRALHAGSQLR